MNKKILVGIILILVAIFLIYDAINLKSQVEETVLQALDPLNKCIDQDPIILNKDYSDKQMTKVINSIIKLESDQAKFIEKMLIAFPLLAGGIYFIFTGSKESEFFELVLKIITKL